MRNPFHIHDYDMEFGDGMSYTLRCRCGDETDDMQVALLRTQDSKIRVGMILVVVFLIGSAWAVFG